MYGREAVLEQPLGNHGWIHCPLVKAFGVSGRPKSETALDDADQLEERGRREVRVIRLLTFDFCNKQFLQDAAHSIRDPFVEIGEELHRV